MKPRNGFGLALVAALAMAIGCAGGNTDGRRSDPALAPAYTGTIGLAACGAEPCTLQLEPTLNLGAIGGTVSVIDVNNRALYRGSFAGTLSGARINGTADLPDLDGKLALSLDADGATLNGAFAFTPDVGVRESGMIETSDARTKAFDPKGTWTGFVEFSANFDLFDTTLTVKAPAAGTASGTATWVAPGGNVEVPFWLRAQEGAAVYLDPASGRSYLSEIATHLGAANLRLVILEPGGDWTAFDVVRTEP
ncbi:MAG: hypothetical protein KIS66_10325 [Fimbriimonadaceae bacterium]|nr:hypothetical protein [Fimbriimonadaceae bacterium]